jgi:hypothetical protein
MSDWLKEQKSDCEDLFQTAERTLSLGLHDIYMMMTITASMSDSDVGMCIPSVSKADGDNRA